MDAKLLGKCGFYCGSCPTYIKGGGTGCMEEHSAGDCYTRDCVLKQGISCCGTCEQFPCDTIMASPIPQFWTRTGCGGRKRVIPTDKERPMKNWFAINQVDESPYITVEDICRVQKK